jgi:hypothetical protein
MTDRDVIERVAGMLGVKAHRTYRDRRNPDWKPLYVLLVRGCKAAELMQLVRPWMGRRQQQQIDQALREHRPYFGKLTSQQRLDIVRRRQHGESASSLAAEFGIARETVYRVKAPIRRGE